MKTSFLKLRKKAIIYLNGPKKKKTGTGSLTWASASKAVKGSATWCHYIHWFAPLTLTDQEADKTFSYYHKQCDETESWWEECVFKNKKWHDRSTASVKCCQTGPGFQAGGSFLRMDYPFGFFFCLLWCSPEALAAVLYSRKFPNNHCFPPGIWHFFAVTSFGSCCDKWKYPICENRISSMKVILVLVCFCSNFD